MKRSEPPNLFWIQIIEVPKEKRRKQVGKKKNININSKQADPQQHYKKHCFPLPLRPQEETLKRVENWKFHSKRKNKRTQDKKDTPPEKANPPLHPLSQKKRKKKKEIGKDWEETKKLSRENSQILRFCGRFRTSLATHLQRSLLLPRRRNPLPRSSPRPSPLAPSTGEEAQRRGTRCESPQCNNLTQGTEARGPVDIEISGVLLLRTTFHVARAIIAGPLYKGRMRISSIIPLYTYNIRNKNTYDIRKQAYS